MKNLIFVTLVFFGFLFGCKPKAMQQAEVKDYTAAYLSYSFLPHLNNTGRANVCVKFVGGTDEEHAAVFKATDQAIRKTIEAWNQLLVGAPGWQQSSIEVNVTERKVCPEDSPILGNSPVLGIVVYLDDTKAIELCKRDFPNIRSENCLKQCRSHTDHSINSINIIENKHNNVVSYMNLSNAEVTVEKIEEVLLHEYGHILILDDTYHEKVEVDESGETQISTQALPGKRASVMNGLSDELNDVDRKDIREVWAALQKNQKQNSKTVANTICPAVNEPGFSLERSQRYTYAPVNAAVLVRQAGANRAVDMTQSTQRAERCEVVEIACRNEVIEKIGNYVKVKFSDGVQGYVHGSQVKYRKVADCP